MAKYIRYIGTSHVRQITRNEWENAGVNDQDTLVWNRTNNWLVPLAKVSDDAYPFIDADSDLVVIERGVTEKPDDRDANDLALTANDAGKVVRPADTYAEELEQVSVPVNPPAESQ